MKILKSMGLGFLLQFVILVSHIFIHMIRFGDDSSAIHLFCSFLVVIVISFTGFVFLKLPIYTIASSQIITFLFIWIIEEPGIYLFWNMYKGGPNLFNPSVYDDAIIIIIEMIIVQLCTFGLAKLIEYVYQQIGKNNKI